MTNFVRRLLPSVVAAVAAVVAIVGGAPALPASAGTAPAERVLVISLPRLTWADLEERAVPPALDGLLASSALASVSPRTTEAAPDLAGGYATIGAGNRAAAGAVGGHAYSASEMLGGMTAAELYGAVTGLEPSGEVLVPAIEEAHQANADQRYGAAVGALGEALRGARQAAAVVGNADGLTGANGDVTVRRGAALAVVDERGQAGGRVDGSLTTPAADAPGGLVLNVAAMAEAFAQAWATHELVVLEAGDLERVDAAGGGSAGRASALARFDQLLSRVLADVDLERHLVLVVSPAPPRRRLALGVAAVAGPGVEPGWASSATTRRDGFLTLPDLAPTILRSLDVEVPSAMTGGTISAGPGPGWSRAARERLVQADEVGRFRDRAVGPVAVAFVAIQVLGYGLAALGVRRLSGPLLRAGGALTLWALAVVPVAFLTGLLATDGMGLAGSVLSLLVAAAAVAAGAMVAGRRLPPAAAGASGLLAALTLGVLAADLVAGGRLQLATPFGYSAFVAGRFAGLGNLASAATTTAAVIVAGLVVAVAPRDRRRRSLQLAGGLLAATVVLIGHPGLGADVGGVLATVPAAAVTLLLLSGRRLQLWRLGVVAALTAAALGAFLALDLARPEARRTHLARLVTRSVDGGAGGLGTVLERKLAANWDILTSSFWPWFIPPALIALAWLLLRPPAWLAATIDRRPGLRAALAGAVVAGALGFALNDSGVALPAMVLGVALPHLTWATVTAHPAWRRAGPLRVGAAGVAVPGAGTPAGTPGGGGS